jgi:sugar lactone lactonase YvrE
MRAGLAVIAAVLCSCNGASSAASPPVVPASPGGTRAAGSATPAVTPAATPAATATLAMCGSARAASTLRVVHTFAVSPDDIAVDGDGRLWVSAREANQLVGMDAGGGAVTTQPLSGGPEGVAAGGGALYVAQQDLNAVVDVGPPQRTVVTLPARTGNDGVDGIAFDAARSQLLLPDSPTGQLYTLRVGATAPTLVASGLGRPVAAVTDPAGTTFVASESTPGLTALSAAGARSAVGHFTDLDEVVWYAGLLYVTELDHRDVLAVDPATGASRVVATGLPAPQGLAVTASGMLEIVDATANTLYATRACGAPG